jgi:hypothetical protein
LVIGLPSFCGCRGSGPFHGPFVSEATEILDRQPSKVADQAIVGLELRVSLEGFESGIDPRTKLFFADDAEVDPLAVLTLGDHTGQLELSEVRGYGGGSELEYLGDLAGAELSRAEHRHGSEASRVAKSSSDSNGGFEVRDLHFVNSRNIESIFSAVKTVEIGQKRQHSAVCGAMCSFVGVRFGRSALAD